MTDLDLLYGKCRRNDRGEACTCLKEGGICSEWITISALVGRPISSYADLVAAMREIRDANETRK